MEQPLGEADSIAFRWSLRAAHTTLTPQAALCMPLFLFYIPMLIGYFVPLILSTKQ